MVYMGIWELKARATGECPWKTVSWYRNGYPSSQALVVLTQIALQSGKFVGFGNNRRKHLNKPEEDRRQ